MSFLTILGTVFIIIGLLILGFNFGIFQKIPLLNKLGHLPGDILIKKDNFVFYFPLTSLIILSLILSLIFIVLKHFL